MLIQFKTWDSNKCGPHIQISQDGLTATKVNTTSWNSAVFGTQPIFGTFKVKIINRVGGNIMIGLVSPQQMNVNGNNFNNGHFIYAAGNFHGLNKSPTAVSMGNIGNGSIVSVNYDSNRKEISFSIDNNNPVVAFTNVNGPLYPALDIHDQGAVVSLV